MLQADAGALADAAQSAHHCSSPTARGHNVSTCLCMQDEMVLMISDDDGTGFHSALMVTAAGVRVPRCSTALVAAGLLWVHDIPPASSVLACSRFRGRRDIPSVC